MTQLQVAEVRNDIQNNTGSSKQSPEGQLARAKALERGRDWSGAIDAYLGITTQDTADMDFLEGVSSAFHTMVKGCLCPLIAYSEGHLPLPVALSPAGDQHVTKERSILCMTVL